MTNTALGAKEAKKDNIVFISEAHEKFYYLCVFLRHRTE